ncbi:rRNA small subunit 7-methylguanosine (m7G) methyltransferase GidB [Sporomusa ovata]|uniref:Glucose-inhibited division protein B n=1 Tax=Sporomusa ovata TaxID=2378 RepID=A0A0U1KS78_9FIRM|nr:rRNA small subunit 7-methylguanosine (m7G) methyltransferase GidB [Sporomusa ovata]
MVKLTGALRYVSLTNNYCLSCYDPKIFPAGCRVIDIASGPGFPGIPLKILRPDLKANSGLYENLEISFHTAHSRRQ